MSNDQEAPLQDRRLQAVVYDLDKKVQALELTGGQYKVELANLKGQADTLSRTTASSLELKAMEELLSLKVDNVHKDLARMDGAIGGLRNILLWGGGLVIAAVIGALLKQVLVP